MGGVFHLCIWKNKCQKAERAKKSLKCSDLNRCPDLSICTWVGLWSLSSVTYFQCQMIYQTSVTVTYTLSFPFLRKEIIVLLLGTIKCMQWLNSQSIDGQDNVIFYIQVKAVDLTRLSVCKPSMSSPVKRTKTPRLSELDSWCRQKVKKKKLINLLFVHLHTFLSKFVATQHQYIPKSLKTKKASALYIMKSQECCCYDSYCQCETKS